MKFNDIKDLTTLEIKERIKDEQLNLSRLRLSHAVSPLENPHRIGDTRKTIARLKTALRQRQLAEQNQNTQG